MHMHDWKQIKTISLGPDELDEWNIENIGVPVRAIEWFVYYYENGGYDGHGIAVWKCRGDKYGMAHLDHCSCYGPCDNFDAHLHKLTAILADLETQPDDYDYSEKKLVLDKVKEITK